MVDLNRENVKGGSMKWKLLAIGAALFAASAFAQDGSGRAKINGEWLEAGAAPGSGESWILDSKENAIHIKQLHNGQMLAEFECSTLGRECDVKESGRHAKVSFYFNGAKLVQLETRGAEVVKRRFSVGDQGDEMEIEVIPVVPAGKPVSALFKRAQAGTAPR